MPRKLFTRWPASCSLVCLLAAGSASAHAAESPSDIQSLLGPTPRTAARVEIPIDTQVQPVVGPEAPMPPKPVEQQLRNAQPLEPLAPIPQVDENPVRVQSSPIQTAPTPAAPPSAIVTPAAEPEDITPEVDRETIRERYPSGRVKVERQVTQDSQGNYVNHGTWKMFTETGELVVTGEYTMGERTGTWNRLLTEREAPLLGTEPYKQFQAPFVSQATFINGELGGHWTIMDARQRVASQIQFKAGQRHGKAAWWYPNGKKLREISFEDGIVEGEAISYDANGAVVASEHYQDGRKLAPKIEYYGPGQKKSETNYLFPKAVVQSRDDYWKSELAVFNAEGEPLKHGEELQWYANGQLKMRGRYEQNQAVGHHVWWYENGQKALAGDYDKGRQSGAWTWWHENGLKKTQGEFSVGHPDGHWTWWNADGQLAQQADLSESSEAVARPLQPPQTNGALQLLPGRTSRR